MSSYHSGLTGEELASAHLRGLGLRVIKTRYRADGGEIDIIAQDGDILCFIEVKYRPEGRLGAGLASVDGDKRARMRRAAKVYLAQNAHPARWRFDTIEITRAGIWYALDAAKQW